MKIESSERINKGFDDNQKVAYIESVGKVDFLHGLPTEAREQITNQVYAKLRQFRLGLYLLNVDIGYKRVQWLSAMNLISNASRNHVANKHLNHVATKYTNKFILNSKGEIDAYYIPEEGTPESFIMENEDDGFGININDLRLEEALKKSYTTKTPTKEDWGIDDVFDIPDEVYDLINLVNKGWQHYQRSTFTCKRFEAYRLQAQIWLKANYYLDPLWPKERQIEFLKAERARCLENSLYLGNKYLWLKDSDDKIRGNVKFKAWPAQEVALFLIDLGLSLIIGKLRQIGFTSTIGGIMALRTMISRNFFIKLVAQKEDKSQEIFEDKIKYAISEAEDYLKPTIPNWSTSGVKFGYSAGKGKSSSTESKIEVVAPAEDAINAGTPSVTLLDEIGFMKKFGAIISQGRSTMFKYDPAVNRMKMVKQIIAWGTGGKTGGVGSAMNVEWKAAKEAFAKRNFRHGLIPLFINYYAKPGHNDEHYASEKAFYYAKKKEVGEEDPKIVFHQSFPITEDDMFMESADTVISVAAINMNMERINRRIAKEERISVRGYFEPIYDTEKPRTYEGHKDSYVPYFIIGARFVPADQSLIDDDSEFACVELFEVPDRTYENLYYKGTDPIFTSSGHSKFSSSIRNALTGRKAAKITYKSEDYRFEYLQSFLLNLYYSREYGGKFIGIKELVESNVGGDYMNFIREMGYSNILVANTMLPEILQTSTTPYGINKNGHTSNLIVNRLEELLMDDANKDDSMEFWVQLRTFVKKHTNTGIKYAPDNKKLHYDDEIDSTVYSKINADCHAHLPIRKLDDAQMEARSSKKLRYYYDSNYNLRLGTAAQAAKTRRQAYGGR